MMQTPTNNNTTVQKEDAFSKYSNDATRLRRLLLKDDESGDKDPTFNLQDFAQRNYVSAANQMKLSTSEVETSKSCNPQDDTGNQRKTRISFEVHPSLILDDMMEDLYNMEDILDGGEVDDDDNMWGLLPLLETRGLQGADDIMDTQPLAQ